MYILSNCTHLILSLSAILSQWILTICVTHHGSSEFLMKNMGSIQVGHMATVLAIATVCWYASLIPEEDVMEGP